jgi:CRP/FNR family transcriptional regulator
MPQSPETLFQAPLFRDLEPDDRQELVSAGLERSISAGQTLFTAGQKAEGIFILESGLLKLVRHSPQGKEMLLHLVHPGESFAEAAMLGEGTYPATAIALESCTVWCCPRSRLIAMIRNSPDLALGMILSVSSWTRQLAAKLEMLTQRRVEERLAIYLMGRAAGRQPGVGDSIPLDEPRNLIAAQIGTVPEVLSRTFRRLADDGIIEPGQDRVRILDPARLLSLAEPLE